MDDLQPQCIGWIQTLFGECKTTEQEAWSFVLGYVSIFCWLNAQVPQIFENFKLRSVASLSLPFLVNWLLGDITNLIGCVLTKQLPFQLYLAIYFCIADVILFGQWIHYSRQEYQQLPLTEILVADAVAEPEHHHHHHHHRRRSHSHSHRPRRATSTGIIPPRSTDGLIEAEDGLDTGATNDAELTTEDDEQSLLPKKRARRLTTTSDIVHRKSTSIVLFSVVMLAMRQTLPALQEHGSKDQFGRGATMQGRVFARALDGDGSNSISEDHSLVQLGRIFAWTCTVFYLSSRMPQLWKNFKRKSVKGLSILMFFWAVMGNLTYSLSIFNKAEVANPETRKKALQESLPYILGSSGTLLFDISIFGQWLYYSGKLGFLGFIPRSHRSRHRHRHHHHHHPHSRQRSRSRADSMALSTSGSHNAVYSTLVDEEDPVVEVNQQPPARSLQAHQNPELDELDHGRRETDNTTTVS